MFSVIIPTFNHIDFLRATLTSLLWQKDDLELEVLVIDNNSNAENPDLIYREFFGKLDMYLIKQPRLPNPYALCKARNIAMKLAKYPWIITLDADIVINPNYLKNLNDFIRLHKDSIITAERIFIDSSQLSELTIEGPNWMDGQKRVKSPANYYLMDDRRLPMLKIIDQQPHPWAYMHGCNMIYPKTPALSIGGYNEAYDGNWGYEDVDFAYRLITQQNINPAYCVGLYCYHLEPPLSNIEETKRFDKKHNPNWIRICATIPGFKEFKEAEYHQISEKIV